MKIKMIGEAIYIRVSDRKLNPIATKRGNVPIQSWSGKSAVFLMGSTLTSHGSSKSKKKSSDGRGISDYIGDVNLVCCVDRLIGENHTYSIVYHIWSIQNYN